MCKLLLMGFDGETKTERPIFETVEDTWEYAIDLGSRWYFYPFYFVVSDSGQTIQDAGFPLDRFIGKRVKTVSNIFNKTNKKLIKNDQENVGVDEFSFIVTE